jgi:hypothetical protein
MPDDLESIPWGEPVGDRIPLAKPERCKHGGTRVIKQIVAEPEPVWAETCGRCGHVFDKAKQRKGFQVQRLAKEIERWAAKKLRLHRVGQYGGQEDLGKASDWAFVQVKSGPSWFSAKQWREIEALPVVAGKRRALVTVEKPGPGGHRRALWIQIMDEVDVPVPAECPICGVLWPNHDLSCVRGA